MILEVLSKLNDSMILSTWKHCEISCNCILSICLWFWPGLFSLLCH